MTLVVGLTGGIGCGKSSASKTFKALGIDVVDTDEIAHKLTQSDGAAIPAIHNLFGGKFIAPDGSLDRKKMRQLIFNDKHSRTKLEALLHPLILEETSKRIRQCRTPYIIVAIPLLIETGDYDHLIQRILVIDCDEQLQIARTMARSQMCAEDVKAIIAVQAGRDQRLTKADDVIVNNFDISYLNEQIFKLHQFYLSLRV